MLQLWRTEDESRGIFAVELAGLQWTVAVNKEVFTKISAGALGGVLYRRITGVEDDRDDGC